VRLKKAGTRPRRSYYLLLPIAYREYSGLIQIKFMLCLLCLIARKRTTWLTPKIRPQTEIGSYSCHSNPGSELNAITGPTAYKLVLRPNNFPLHSPSLPPSSSARFLPPPLFLSLVTRLAKLEKVLIPLAILHTSSPRPSVISLISVLLLLAGSPPSLLRRSPNLLL
jgi:hypothetical protein